ncbi:MAG: YabP/YqfC family sporulation protein [Clostridia bacterium]|nr:YabP/YqfC family sporulation protein [Clostridia bacterium]
MGFYESICKILNGTPTMPSSYRITIISNYGAYIEGAVRVLDVNSKEVLIEVKQGKIVIGGKNLSLGSYSEKDATVLGEILKVEKR